MTAIWVLVALVVVGLGYIRLAPSDPARWHRIPDISADEDLQGGVKRLIPARADSLKHLDAFAQATARTRVLAGSVEEGMITYITRTRVIGFPDYTTVQLEDGQLKIFARLRFGRRDFDVNRARVDKWIAMLRQVEGG